MKKSTPYSPENTVILLLHTHEDVIVIESVCRSVIVLGLAGVVRAGEELGQRASETSQPQHRNSSGREQGGPGQQESAGLPGRVTSGVILQIQPWPLMTSPPAGCTVVRR